MNAENKSASLVSQLKLSKGANLPQNYYRSRLFVSSSPTNPLLAAASPIFSILERLNSTLELPQINDLIHNIEHEINSFQSRLIAHRYADEVVLVSRYLVSATIDELLGKNLMRIYSEPVEFKAFTQFGHDDSAPQEQFFQIISFIKERPNQYLDLVELSYFCLITGFEGQYYSKPNGRQELDNTIEELFQLIQQNRVNNSLRLFNLGKTVRTDNRKKRSHFIISCMIITLLSSTYFISHMLLDYKAKKIFNGYSKLAKLDK
tara:strand:+ start:626 stop:1411 length:786 start_codon:yes stop_codon:yes gene_type:complete